MSNEQQASQAPRGRRRTFARGAFPRLPLKEALPVAEAIQALGHGEQVRRRSVFSQLGRSPDSGRSRLLMAVANGGYGLVTGSSDSEYLGITGRGAQVVAAQTEAERGAAIYEALFENPIFAGLISHFNDRPVPVDEVAIDYLRRDHSLSVEDATTAWQVFGQNMRDFGLVQDLSGKEIVVSREVALQSLGGAVSTREDLRAGGPAPSEGAGVALPRATGVRSPGDTVPQIHLNVQIVLPENASPETYDAILASIAVHLLPRDR